MNFKNPFCFFVISICLFPSILFSQTDSFPTLGKASFYHDNFQGRETSNGEEYDKNDFTAAHRTLPFNTLLLVTCKHNDKSVVVRVNDRGPFKKSRIIDLTRSAAMKLEMIPFGVVPVKIQQLTFLDKYPLNDSTIKENEVWDCFSRKAELNDSVIFVWQTESVKHAFYMASEILLDYRLENTFVKAVGSGAKRKYSVVIEKPTGIEERNALIKKLKKDGFRFAKII